MTKETLFALSLFPYLGFLWFLSKSGQTPRLALWGFYMLLVFVAVTIPAGAYTQFVLKESLANVDPIHGGAEFFLTLSNILVVLGFRQAIQEQKALREPPQQN
jgi:heme A synthase